MFHFKTWRKNRRISATHLVFVWFGSAILAGTLILWSPPSLTGPETRLDFISALFTSVSAACVTGLSVVNVADTFSPFGQVVIFLLMELGGLGIMTFAVLGFRLFGRRLSLSQQSAAADSIYQNDAMLEFRQTITQILKVNLAIQAAGAAGMAVCLVPGRWNGTGADAFAILWSAAFHAASAFCNSGFTIYRDSLQSLYGNIPFLVILMILVTLGGLGHMTLNELCRLPGFIRKRENRPHWISLHTRVTLVTTAILIVAGIIGIRIAGTGDGKGDLWHAAFETIVGRTAGFNISPQTSLPLPSLLIVILLMFIGGSPGSCAGGIKTTSLAIWTARIKANLRNDANVNLFGYTIAPELVSRARILMALTMLWNLAGVFLLSLEHPREDLQTLIFEQVSAFGTVGLSLDFTSRLTDLSRLWICVSMFVGRLGPLSIALWVVPAARMHVNRPIGRLMVG